MKLNLQLFAEEDTVVDVPAAADPGIEDTGAEIDGAGLSFEEMYENGPQDDVGDGDGTGDDDTGEGEGDEYHPAPDDDGQQPWKTQHNAEMAAQRRRQEEAARVQQARDELIRETYAGQVNPYTNKPILTEADFRQYQQQYQQEQLQNAGINPELINEMVNNHPAIKQAQAVMAQQHVERGQQLLTEGIREISKFDSDIKSFDDLYKSEHFAQVNEMVNRGYSLPDAYRLANMDKLMQRKQAAAKQQVINQATGKQHMRATGQNGAGADLQVPADVLSIYREMMPGMTDAQIREHYNKTKKG